MRGLHSTSAVELSALIGCIYDAAANADLWPTALERTTRFLNGVAAVIVSEGTGNCRPVFACSVGDDPHYTALYAQHYARISPLTPKVRALENGAVYTASKLLPGRALTATAFFQDWLRPQGYCDNIGTVLDRSADVISSVVVSRHSRQGPIESEALRRMSLLAPHFRRAIAIGQCLEFRRDETLALEETIDALRSAVILVDAESRMVRINPGGHALLTRADVLRSSGGRLQATAADLNLRLQAAIGAASMEPPDEGHDLAFLACARNRERYRIHVLPLAPGSRRGSEGFIGTRRGGVATAAVFVCAASLDLATLVRLATRGFALTPAETRVLRSVLRGQAIPAVAREIGVGEATVKTHLQHLFAKTSTRRQIDLVRLVAGLSLRILDDAP